MTPASNVKLLTFLAAVEKFQRLPKGYYHRDSLGQTHFKSRVSLLFHPKYPDTELVDWFNKQRIVYHPASTTSTFRTWLVLDDFSYYYSAARSPPLYGKLLYIHKNYRIPYFTKQSTSYSHRYWLTNHFAGRKPKSFYGKS